MQLPSAVFAVPFFTLANKVVVTGGSQEACETLNLSHHVVGTASKRMLWGPTDIEGHLIHAPDSPSKPLFYVLDVARLFPPMATVTDFPNCGVVWILKPGCEEQVRRATIVPWGGNNPLMV